LKRADDWVTELSLAVSGCATFAGSLVLLAGEKTGAISDKNLGKTGQEYSCLN
jgi:hypothetical protein